MSFLILGVFRAMLHHYDRRRHIDWEWQAADTKLLPAPLGGSASGPKRHLLIGGNGAPLGLHLTGANRHDMKGLATLLEQGLIVPRPKPTRRKRPHLCLDKAYDYAEFELALAEQKVSHV